MPAGDFEKMQFAIAFGADAVYLGIPQFSLRARENGFRKRESVIEALQYAHARGKKVYITANVFAHNHKVDSFIKYVGDFLNRCQPDAWIMSDPGLIMLMKEHFPKEAIHLSVQANTVNFASAQFWQKLDIRRIILSRELSINEIKVIRQNCPDLELEAFVHGAICIAYSGRCLISNYMSYRDANQGTCANSCRWEYKLYQKADVQPPGWHENAANDNLVITQHEDPYVRLQGDYYLEENQRPGELMPIDEDENGTYLMNARDLCGIEYLKELYESGINSFKVEGRSKSVYYAALIAKAYRRAIDDMLAGKKFDPRLFEDIYATSNRGLIAGFLKGNPGYTAQEYEKGRSEYSHYRFSGIVRGFDKARKLMKVEPRNSIRQGMVLEMILPNETKRLRISKIIDDRGEEIPEIHGGLKSCWIPYPENPGEFVLLKERLC
jgi:putative protease